MGRPKEYDRATLAERAMHVFWSDGYASTSARQLAEATGVNVSTLYAEFGSKEGVYRAALELYERDMVAKYIGALDRLDAGIATIREVLLQYPEFARAEGGAPGCLLCNAAVEQAPTSDISQGAMARYVERISTGIARALANDRSAASSVTDDELLAFGHHLTAVVLGLFVMIRAKVEVAVLDDAVRHALAEVDAVAARLSRRAR